MNETKSRLYELFEMVKDHPDYIKILADDFIVERFGENYISTRGFILNVHFRLEQLINYLLSLNYSPNLSSNERHLLCNDVFSFVPFAQKVKLLKKYKLYNKGISIASSINDIRNGFAHGDPKDSKRYQYKKASIFNSSTIKVIWKDVQIFFYEHGEVVKKISKDSIKTL